MHHNTSWSRHSGSTRQGSVQSRIQFNGQEIDSLWMGMAPPGKPAANGAMRGGV
jgi:hypothetical protein